LGCSNTDECMDGLDLMPMYGTLVEKCDKQDELNKRFIEKCDKEYIDRGEAVLSHLEKAWGYLEQKDPDMAMRVFNQAWLLDSSNADVYWGFAMVLGVRQSFLESLYFFEKSLRINPDNPEVWHSASISYGSLYMQTKNKTYLQNGINCLRNVVIIDDTNPVSLAHLSAAFAIAGQRDSVEKYWKLTKKINPEATDPDVERILAAK
jgi:tetratricopeptide (TPR) repeat protein